MVPVLAVGERSGGGEEVVGRRAIVRTRRPSQQDGPPVDDEDVPTELADVLDRPDHAIPTSQGGAVAGEGSEVEHSGQTGPPKVEAVVEAALLVAAERLLPPHVASELDQGVRRAEADGQQLEARGPEVRPTLVHLHEVLLAWQSVAVADERDEGSTEAAEVDLAARRRLEEDEVVERLVEGLESHRFRRRR